MATQQVPAGADTAAPSTTLALQGVYLKDCSFESPNGPRGSSEWNPQISMDLNTAVQPIAGDVREVVLTITVSAKQAEQTLFLVEVKQAGVFVMQNLSEGAVPVRARHGVAAREPGRLSAVAAAAGEFRSPIRQLAERSRQRDQELGAQVPCRPTASRLPRSPCSGPAPGVPRSPSNAHVPGGRRACGAAIAPTSRPWLRNAPTRATCPTWNFRKACSCWSSSRPRSRASTTC